MVEIPIQRLRMPLLQYKHLDKVLKLVKKNGFLPDGSRIHAEIPNTKQTISKLGLVDDTGLTVFGEDILAKWKDKKYVKKRFAEKFIIEWQGWAYCYVLYCRPRAKREDLAALYEDLFEWFPEHYDEISNTNNLLTWVGLANKFGRTYQLNLKEYKRMFGIGFDELDLLNHPFKIKKKKYVKLNQEEKFCLLALIILQADSQKNVDVKDIRKKATFLRGGKKINTHNMQNYGTKLSKRGFIKYKKGGAGERGEKGQWELIGSETYDEIKKKHFQEFIQAGIQNMDFLTKPMKKIVKDLDSRNSYVRGTALEEFAAKICWALNIRDIELRASDADAGVELDVIGVKKYPFYSKFLVQCKNFEKKKGVGPPIIAKELGTAFKDKFNNIMIFSTSGFVDNAKGWCAKAMQSTGVNIYLFEEKDIKELIKNEEQIHEILREKDVEIGLVRSNTDSTFDFLKPTGSSAETQNATKGAMPKGW